MIWEPVRILRRSNNPCMWNREPFVLLDQFWMDLSLKFISNSTNITYMPWHWLIKDIREENLHYTVPIMEIVSTQMQVLEKRLKKTRPSKQTTMGSKQKLRNGKIGLQVRNQTSSSISKINYYFLRRLSYQKIPSKMLATVKEDCANTTITIMCVHAYWPNWYLYIFFFNERMNHIKPEPHLKDIVISNYTLKNNSTNKNDNKPKRKASWIYKLFKC